MENFKYRKLVEPIYKIRMGCLIKNHDIDKDIDSIIYTIIKYDKIKKYTRDTHWGYIEFWSGIKIKFWNANKYYSWISEGEIILPNHLLPFNITPICTYQRVQNLPYKWRCVCLSSYTMYIFKKMIDKGEMRLDDIRDEKLENLIKEDSLFKKIIHFLFYK